MGKTQAHNFSRGCNITKETFDRWPDNIPQLSATLVTKTKRLTPATLKVGDMVLSAVKDFLNKNKKLAKFYKDP